MPEVTVVIPSYNSSATIEAAVRSALTQTEPVDVIVVDDGSKDDTVGKLQALALDHSNLTVLVQPNNQGPSAARNRAIAAAKTNWIAILDGDDYMHPDRLRRMLQIAVAEDLDLVADDLIRIPSDPNPETGTRLWSDTSIGLVRIDLARFARENIDENTGYRRELGYVKPLMRRDFLKSHSIHYNETMRLAEDYDFYMQALLAGAQFGIIDPCGYFSIDYPSSLSKDGSASDARKVLDRDIEFLKHRSLSPAERRAVHEHKMLAHKHWAWIHLIDMVRTRNVIGVVRTMIAPPQVLGALFLRLSRHALGKKPVPHAFVSSAQTQSIEAMLANSAHSGAASL
ncbi:MAG: glycosyltransferase family 2 protein [Hyphomonas sp.]